MFAPSGRHSTFALLLLLQSGCDPSVPPTSGQPLASVTVLETSCTEAWVRITLNPEASPRTIELRKLPASGEDTSLILSTTLAASETLIVDPWLVPSTDYTYSLSLSGSPVNPISRSTARTLDTTSHKFAWQIDTLGVAYSMLGDVTLIDDTLAYAVGEIYQLDSTGQIDNLFYNIARWNGSRWEISRIITLFGGNLVTPRLRRILFQSSSSIWVAGDGRPIHWGGASWTMINLDPLFGSTVSALRMCGSPSDTYFIGRHGTILKYNGSAWAQYESGTTVELNDIWINQISWQPGITRLVVGSDAFTAGEKKLLMIGSDGAILDLSWPFQDRAVNSVWFTKGSGVYICGDGVLRSIQLRTWMEAPLRPVYSTCVRGSAANNVFVVGHFGYIAHFNGKTWNEYHLGFDSCILESVAVKENMVVAVGWTGGKGIVIRGYR